jgi:hypothetical protein
VPRPRVCACNTVSHLQTRTSIVRALLCGDRGRRFNEQTQTQTLVAAHISVLADDTAMALRWRMQARVQQFGTSPPDRICCTNHVLACCQSPPCNAFQKEMNWVVMTALTNVCVFRRTNAFSCLQPSILGPLQVTYTHSRRKRDGLATFVG